MSWRGRQKRDAKRLPHEGARPVVGKAMSQHRKMCPVKRPRVAQRADQVMDPSRGEFEEGRGKRGGVMREEGGGVWKTDREKRKVLVMEGNAEEYRQQQFQ